ncbi:Gfo/Idh/MocA family oxidoreductase [Ktedonosporobacter rubrisoli]|uniref:Gfo/Idh/MocA family oxidoreductase n=1 Tax=Ktedonosporobacter rubrisoli TaxID=2509675 RepID=A0A4P6JNN1_KTERU|nr:Gfo/Idh/MocA family oxidoreductase [Ktedonosporobacter rubrisoli]QBD76927.1 Gfo/Idh/MocA family oxidoreductase [Ktedonosporobacter rubrisoli]
MERYRVAIVGTGGIAGSHMQACQELRDRVKVIAAVEIDRARGASFCDQYNIPRLYTDVTEMLEAEKPDLVQIATPPATHYSLALRCLEAGAWVLCEKPLCTSLAELDHIARIEKQHGIYCSSVFQWRFGSGAKHLRHLIQTRTLGRPLVGICQTTWYRDQAYFEVPWRGKWATEGGGPTMGHGIHLMDLFVWLLGDWDEVCAMADTLDRAIEVEDVSMAVVRFKQGTLGSIVNSVLSPRQESYLRLDLQQATVDLRALYSYTNQDWRYHVIEPGSQEHSSIPGEVVASHAAQLAALLESMDRKEQPVASTLAVRPTLELITCIYKAAASGQTIRSGSIAESDPYYYHVAGKREPQPQ